MGRYDELYQSPEMKARAASQSPAASKPIRPAGKITGKFAETFDHKGAQQAKLAKAEIDARRAKVGAERSAKAAKAAKAAKVAKVAKVSRPGIVKNTAAKVGEMLTKPIGTKVGLGTVLRGAGTLAKTAAGPVGWAATAAAYGGDSVKDTDTAQAMQRPVTDAIANITGTEDLQNRMMSNDPEVSKAAVAEYKASQGAEGTTPQLPVSPGEPAPVETAPEGVPTEAGAIERPYTTETEGEVYHHAANNQAQAGPDINAANGQAIPNTDAQYVGNYGDNEVINRPTIGNDGKPVIDPATGQAVPEFTDTDTAFGRQRPAQTAQANAIEQARVAQAREDYTANTTGSDGRRYYGGEASERLHAMQNESAKNGQNSELIQQQQFKEGLSPEEVAAYTADPAGTLNGKASVDRAQANAQIASAKENYTRNRQVRSDKRLARTNAMKEATAMLSPYKDSAPEAYQQLYAMASQRYDGSVAMPQLVQQMMSELDMDTGAPEVEGGRLKMRQVQELENSAPELDPFIQ